MVKLTWQREKTENTPVPRGFDLLADGRLAGRVSVNTEDRAGVRAYKGWYFVAGLEHPAVAHKTTNEAPVETAEEAMRQCEKYVRAQLKVK